MDESVTNVPGSSGAGGNTSSPATKSISPAKRWCFTLNNYTIEDVSAIQHACQRYARYAICGRELGAGGTLHLQGYIEFIKKDRPINSKYALTKRIHWERAKGSRSQNQDYCRKEGQWWEYPKKYNISIQLYAWQKELLSVLSKKPDDRSIYWIWEEKGCAGKTVFQKYLFVQSKWRIVVLSGKCADMKHGIVKFKQDTNQLPELVIVNIPKCNGNHMSIAALESIKDMFFYSGKYEGGMVCGPNPHVMVFANEPPEYGILSKDRVKELYIGDVE